MPFYISAFMCMMDSHCHDHPSITVLPLIDVGDVLPINIMSAVKHQQDCIH